MPYVLLIIGILLGLYGLVRFADKASPGQMKTLFEAFFALLLAVALLYLILSERLGLIVLWLVIALPFFLAVWRKRRLAKIQKENDNEDSDEESNE